MSVNATSEPLSDQKILALGLLRELIVFLVTPFTIIINLLKVQIVLKLLITNGQKPLPAYYIGTVLLVLIIMPSSIDPLLRSVLSESWLGVFIGVIVTYILTVILLLFTRVSHFATFYTSQ